MNGTGRIRRTVVDRREEILDGALAEIDRVGLASLRVSDVAAALGVSTGLIFYHFGTKDDLVASAFRLAVERDLAHLKEVLDTPLPLLERVRMLLRTSGPTGSAAGWRMWIEAWAHSQREPLLAEQLRRMDGAFRQTLRELLDEGIADGSFACADPTGAVLRISAMLDGFSVSTVVLGSMSRSQLHQWLDEAVVREFAPTVQP